MFNQERTLTRTSFENVSSRYLNHFAVKLSRIKIKRQLSRNSGGMNAVEIKGKLEVYRPVFTSSA